MAADSQYSYKVLSKRIIHFCSTTSAHGFAKIKDAQSLWRKVFWCVAMLVILVLLGWQMTTLANSYFSYHKSINIHKERGNVSFPTLVFCRGGMMPISDAYYNTTQLQTYKKLKDKLLERLVVYYGKIFDTTDMVMAYANSYLSVLLPLILTSFGERLEIGNYQNSIRQMLLLCHFRLEPCDDSFFEEIYIELVGPCLKFNPKSTAAMTDSNHMGLMLTLYAEPREKNQYSTVQYHLFDAHGVFLMVMSDDAEARFIKDMDKKQLIFASAGSHLQTGLTKEKIKLLSTPSEPCQKETEYVLADGTLGTFPYSASFCYDAYINSKIFEKCGCVFNNLVIGPEQRYAPLCQQMKREDFTVESLSEYLDHVINQILCAHDIWTIFATNPRNASICVNACEENIFKSTTTSALLYKHPEISTQYAATLLKRMKVLNDAKIQNNIHTILNDNQTDLISMDVISNNLVNLNIKIDSEDITVQEEVLSYPLINFLSEMGGVIGFWVGCSMLTIVEFLELVADLVRLLTCRMESTIDTRADI